MKYQILIVMLMSVTDEISTLIKECTSQGLRFIYGIAPGLNITFSNERDAKYLRDKLDQV